MVCKYYLVILIGDQTEELDVGVGELWDGSLAATGASALERVRGAGGDLLGREVGQRCTVDLDVALNLVN